MRKTTIVVAVLAATIASAQAAPDRAAARGPSSKSAVAGPQQVQRSAANQNPNAAKTATVPSEERGAAAAFTSARNAAPAAAPVAQPAPPAAAESRRIRTRTAQAPRTADRRRQASVRRLVAKSRPASLQREVDVGSASGRAGAAAAAPTASIPAMVTAAAHRAGVNPALAHAVVKVESRYQPNATGPGGFIGLMQLSYRTAQGMGFKGSRRALYQPDANLTYGMRYLAEAVRKAGGHTCGAVSKYQGGHAVRGVTRAGAVYCAKVKRFMAEGYGPSQKVASR